MDEKPDESCCFDEWAIANAKRARKREIASPVTRALVSALDRAGLSGRTVLDVGCGTGDLALATLARGATHADGVDLGPKAIDAARELAAERGLTDLATFEVGDGSVVPLVRHDVVALNRVVCCYPNPEALLDNTLGAVGDVFAFTAPRHTGLAGVWNGVLLACGNAYYRLRDRKFRGFRVFRHDLDLIDARVRREGLRPVASQSVRFVWHLAVYTRTA